MVSLLGALTSRQPDAQPPVPYTSRASRWTMPWGLTRDRQAQLDAPGGNGTLFAIQERIGHAVAKATWHLYRSAKSGKDEDRVEVTSHAALDLWRKPNKFYTAARFKRSVQQHKDLTGEGYLVVVKAGTLPLELWPVRPDRMTPVPDPDKFLAGYVYTSPDGEQIPLDVDAVIPLIDPHPTDPYRGMGAVQSILADIDSARYSAEWNRNFFLNSAEPGGIIEIEKVLGDTEFDTLATRWDEQHRGVSKAHRVAILEGGMKWVDRNISQKDMQFVELRNVTRDQILEGFGFPKSMLGIVEDSNRANSEEANTMFAQWLIVPRLDDIRDALNTLLLPMYGQTATGLEFDYDSPVPEDEAAENAERESKATAAKTYIEAGFHGDSVKTALELPDSLVWEKPAPPPPPVVPGPAGPTPAEPGAQPPEAPQPPEDPVAALLGTLVRGSTRAVLNDAGWPTKDVDAVEAVDLGPVQAAWEAALAALLETWQSSVVADWIRQLIDGIRNVLRGDGGTLADLRVDTTAAAGHLSTAMHQLAQTAAEHAVAEAARQEITLQPVWPSAADLEAAARQVAAFEGSRYALSAGREAARIAGPKPDADAITGHVEQFLSDLSDAGAKYTLAGALTDAQNQGRFDTLTAGPVGALYANEILDSATCKPCREIHGRWICNTDDLAALYKLYPFGGYVDCLGREKCRGTVVGVWRPKTTEGGQ